jgi:carboxymethylenebutenolidase
MFKHVNKIKIMKKIYTLAIALIFSASAFSQTKMACCNTAASTPDGSTKSTATVQFASLADDKSFVQEHQNPAPFTATADLGEKITFKAADGTDASGFMIKAVNPTNNYIFVIHEWWGLNDYIKEVSGKLYKDLGNINVIALDLYDGKVATTQEMAGKYMQGADENRIKNIINGAINLAGPNAKIATIGWCFGGGWSLQTAIMLGKQAAGCVMYYGMPETNVERLQTLNTDVLAIFANKDGWITPKVAEDFKTNMNKAGKKLTLKQYDADHAFANPSNPIYNSVAASDAYAATLSFLMPRLK